MQRPLTVESVVAGLRANDYLADEGLATAIFLALRLHRPLLLEGEAGVGKTEVAKVLSAWTGGELIRLQCYEGIDVTQAVYEWDYARQLLHIRTAEALGMTEDRARFEDELYTRQFLVSRPLLRALEHHGPMPPVLLIDEIDRADDEFEAFLLEILSEFAITIPELGTIRAERPPVAVLTSNRTREVHDALKRRCLYYWIDFPTYSKEYRILSVKVPDAPEQLRTQICGFTQGLREVDLFKPPGMAETLDWAQALLSLGTNELTTEMVDDTLGVILKYQEDVDRVRGDSAGQLIERANRAPAQH